MALHQLDLGEIAAHLEGLEETIVHKLIDRAQFRRNRTAYAQGHSGFQGAGDTTLFDLRLRQQEEVDARFGRFSQPEERPFTPNLPSSRRAVTTTIKHLAIEDYDKINLTSEIKGAYLAILDWLCVDGDDGQYGSSVEHDVFSVQAISRRIHYGAFFVAESKYRADPERFETLRRAGNTIDLEKALTRPEVEARILERVRGKVCHQQEKVNRSVRTLIDADRVAEMYRQVIIPLTKRGEVLYLLARS